MLFLPPRPPHDRRRTHPTTSTQTLLGTHTRCTTIFVPHFASLYPPIRILCYERQHFIHSLTNARIDALLVASRVSSCHAKVRGCLYWSKRHNKKLSAHHMSTASRKESDYETRNNAVQEKTREHLFSASLAPSTHDALRFTHSFRSASAR